jgi:hypothetical protein
MFAKFAKFVKRFLQSILRERRALLREKIKSSKNSLKNSPKTALVSRSQCHFTEILRHFRTTLCAIAQQKFFRVEKNSEKGRYVSA